MDLAGETFLVSDNHYDTGRRGLRWRPSLGGSRRATRNCGASFGARPWSSARAAL